MTKVQVPADSVIVGSYSLESLTTGMYEDPRHCIREYVQNGYDAIRAARTAELIGPTEGIVTVSIGGSQSRPTITVKDDGTGIPSAQAVSILVSVGASTKRSTLNAGFRGIGRLAGIAYCTALRFTTTVAGEDVATVVEFDCGRLRGFMKPSADYQDIREVIRLCSSSDTKPALVDAHWTEVEMIGLTGVGLEFAEIEKLVPYLREVCPTDYSDRFTFAPRIRNFAETVGHPIGSIEVETRYKRERTQILKAYDDATPTSDPRKPSTVNDIELINNAELGWHGWIARSNFKGELTDDTVAGVRFRMKNIQIDGSDLIETLGSELTLGGTEGRLQRYAVGEIFITNPAVIPNARRDGFEDSAAWRQIRSDVKMKVAKRVVTLVREASKSRTALRTMASEIAGLARKIDVEWIEPLVADQVSASINRLLVRLKPDKLTGGDPNEVGGHISKLKTLQEKLEELRNRPKPQPEESGEQDENDSSLEGDDGEGEDNGNDTGRGSSKSDDAGDKEDIEPPERWPADRMLAAVRFVIEAEQGAKEAQRIFEAAAGHLASGSL
jgi:molecular chaperone HtpG